MHERRYSRQGGQPQLKGGRLTLKGLKAGNGVHGCVQVGANGPE